MTTHSETNIDKLILSLKEQCTDGLRSWPVTVWWDRWKQRHVAKRASDYLSNKAFHGNPRFDLVGTISLDQDPMEIRLMIEDNINKNIKDFPVRTSLNNHAERIQRNNTKWDEN